MRKWWHVAVRELRSCSVDNCVKMLRWMSGGSEMKGDRKTDAGRCGGGDVEQRKHQAGGMWGQKTIQYGR